MRLTTSDVVHLINNIEQSFDVKEWKINDIRVWPIIRLTLAFSLDSISDKKKYTDKKSIVFHLIGFSKTLFYNLFHWYSLKKTTILFITYSSAKHNKIKEKWFDSYLDPIANILEKNKISYQFLEYDGNYDFRFSSFHKFKIIQYHLFYNLIKARYSEKKVLIDEFSINLIENINKYLINKGLSNFLLTENLVRKKVSQIIFNNVYFTKLLQMCKPSVVIGSNYYGIEMALNLACRKMNIKSIDIQHGVQGDYHVAYGSWKKIPETGYDLLPDIFAVWSEEEKKVIDKWAEGTYHKAKIIGHPMRNYLAIAKGQNRISERKNCKINVLITLQTGRGFIKLYKELLEFNNHQIFWFIRKHPTMGTKEQREIKKELSFYNKSIYNYENASDEVLFDLLERIDIHISENSSVVIEAAQYGIPTILVHESGKDLYEREILSGKAFFITQPQQIIEKINSLKSHKNPFAKSLDYSQFEERIIAMIKD